MKQQINFRASDLTARQLSELAARWGTSQTETLTVCIDRAHREEFPMTVTIPTETPDAPEWVAAHPAAAYGWKADLAFRVECLNARPYRRYNLLKLADERFGDAAATERRRKDADELGL